MTTTLEAYEAQKHIISNLQAQNRDLLVALEGALYGLII